MNLASQSRSTMPALPQLRINLWSGPRNVSTALMYAFAQRADTRVVDEPLYAHYLRCTGAQHPGRDEILKAMDNDGVRVVQEVLLGPCDRPVLFVKNMGHHLVDLDWGFLEKVTTVFLIRDPREMLPSLINQVPQPTLADTALKRQADIMDYLRDRGYKPAVLDARQLLVNPRSVLSELCEHLGMAFEESMLQWPAGPRPEEGVWAPHWYHVIHTTTGFSPYKAKTAPYPAFLEPLLRECKPYYDHLYRFAIRA